MVERRLMRPLDDPAHRAPRYSRHPAGETRSAQIAGLLRAAIISGTYHAGERLVELTLAHQFDVSQNTIRDSLRILEQEGWVVKKARRGVYLRTFSVDEVEELFALLIAVETLALRRALTAVRGRLPVRLTEGVAAARRAVYSGDLSGCMQRLFDLHEQLALAFNHQLTAQVLKTLYNQVRLLEAIHQARAPRMLAEIEAQIALHQRIAKAVEAGDLSAAEGAVITFLSEYSTRTIEVLRLLR
ncbi:GntR family transcriptional regulator [Anaerolineae bacterium CFX9]|nr:GntR family transcriptional regulator [Anaerolineae bacterium CFX9]